MKDFMEEDMAYAQKKQNKTTWVSVPLEDRLHENVRARAVRRRIAWPDIIAEALGMWLAAQKQKTA